MRLARTMRPSQSRLRRFTTPLVLMSLIALAVTGPTQGADNEGPSSAVVRAAMDFREHMGFRHDRDFVESTFASSSDYPDDTWGTPLSKAEAADMFDRIERRGHYQDAVDWAVKQDGYAGLWFDQRDAGKPHFAFTGKIDDRRDALRNRITGDLPFEVERFERPFSELVDTTVRIMADLDDLQKDGLLAVYVAPDTRDNGVVVGVIEPGSQDQDLLRERYGQSVVVEETRGVTEDACNNRKDCDNPLKGGLWAQEPAMNPDNTCTLGPWGKSSSDTKYLITAGHCFKSWNGSLRTNNWIHPVPPNTTSTIGPAQNGTYFAAGSCDCAQVDVGWINPDSSSDEGPYSQFIGSSNTDVRVSEFRAGEGFQAVGDVVCRSAIHDPKWHCDEVTAHLSGVKSIDGGPVNNLFRVSFDASCGDSGAPYYAARIVGTQVLWGIAGTHSDSTNNAYRAAYDDYCGDSVCSTCYSWYNTIDTIDQYSPLTVCWRPTC